MNRDTPITVIINIFILYFTLLNKNKILVIYLSKCRTLLFAEQ